LASEIAGRTTTRHESPATNRRKNVRRAAPPYPVCLHVLLQENYGDVHINISDDSIYTGALGAAHFALRDATRGSAVTL